MTFPCRFVFMEHVLQSAVYAEWLMFKSLISALPSCAGSRPSSDRACQTASSRPNSANATAAFAWPHRQCHAIFTGYERPVPYGGSMQAMAITDGAYRDDPWPNPVRSPVDIAPAILLVIRPTRIWFHSRLSETRRLRTCDHPSCSPTVSRKQGVSQVDRDMYLSRLRSETPHKHAATVQWPVGKRFRKFFIPIPEYVRGQATFQASWYISRLFLK